MHSTNDKLIIRRMINLRDVGMVVRYRCTQSGVISFDPFSFMKLQTKIQIIDKYFGFILACNIVYHPISRFT